jgi:hypothetical protein
MKNFKSKITGYIGIAALLFMCSFSAGAQRVEFGVRFMPTFSKFDIQTSSGGKISGEGTLGFGVGALLGFSFTKHVGVQAEVIYSALAQKYKEQNVEREIKLKYFNIPLLLSLNTGKTKMINLNIVAGPQIGISAGSSLHISSGSGADSTNAVLAVKKGDLGFAYGVGLDFGLNPSRTARLSIGYRGVYGLLDISDDSATLTTESFYVLDRSHIKTNAAYIGLSFLF